MSIKALNARIRPTRLISIGTEYFLNVYFMFLSACILIAGLLFVFK